MYEAEKSVLGCILLNKDCYLDISHLIESKHFLNYDYRVIFESVERLHKDKTPIDMVTVATDLKSRGLLEDIGGTVALADMQNDVPVSTHAKKYAQIVRNDYSVKELRDFSELVLEVSSDSEMKLPERLNICEKKLKEIYSSALAIPKPTMMQLSRDYEVDQATPTIKTGISWLDKCTGGIKRGKLWMLVAPSGTGKTTIALQILCNILSKGHKVNFYSVEFDNPDMYSYLSRVTDEFTNYDIDDIHYKWKLNFSRERNWDKIKSDAISDAPDLVVIDYIQALNSAEKDPYRKLASLSLEVMEFTRDTGIAVILLSQVSKNDSKSGHIYAKGAGELKENCDVLIGLLSDKEAEKEQKKQQPGFSTKEKVVKRALILDKNRYGSEGGIPIKYNYEQGKGYYVIE